MLKILERWAGFKRLAQELSALEQRVATLETEMAKRPNPPTCPVCQAPMRVAKVEPHPVLKAMGVQQHTLQCTVCSHSETRRVDPPKAG